MCSRSATIDKAHGKSSDSAAWMSCEDDPNPYFRSDWPHAEHTLCEKHRPSPQALHQGLPPANRQETVHWLVQAFDVMRFEDGFVYDAMLLLDRLYGELRRPETTERAQRRLLAAVCTTLKLGPSLQTLYSTCELVTHLGRKTVPFAEVLQAEYSMLRVLRFQTGTPTAHDVMVSMRERLRQILPASDGCDRLHAIAAFLLQLALIDADVFYGHSHAMLATSCFRLAMLASDAPPKLFHALVDDLKLQLRSSEFQPCLDDCSRAIHRIWLISSGELRESPYFAFLYKKFSQSSRHLASQVTPVVTVSRLERMPSVTMSGSSEERPTDDTGSAHATVVAVGEATMGTKRAHKVMLASGLCYQLHMEADNTVFWLRRKLQKIHPVSECYAHKIFRGTQELGDADLATSHDPDGLLAVVTADLRTAIRVLKECSDSLRQSQLSNIERESLERRGWAALTVLHGFDQKLDADLSEQLLAKLPQGWRSTSRCAYRCALGAVFARGCANATSHVARLLRMLDEPCKYGQATAACALAEVAGHLGGLQVPQVGHQWVQHWAARHAGSESWDALGAVRLLGIFGGAEHLAQLQLLAGKRDRPQLLREEASSAEQRIRGRVAAAP